MILYTSLNVHSQTGVVLEYHYLQNMNHKLKNFFKQFNIFDILIRTQDPCNQSVLQCTHVVHARCTGVYTSPVIKSIYRLPLKNLMPYSYRSNTDFYFCFEYMERKQSMRMLRTAKHCLVSAIYIYNEVIVRHCQSD